MKVYKFIFSLVCLFYLFVVKGWTQTTFKFAQLSDIHIVKGDSMPLIDLKRSIKQINASPDIDFVLVTGDLTDNGDRASLYTVKETLSTLNKKYYIIPGNHETTWSESGLTDFSRLWGSERFSFVHKGFLFLGFNTGPFIRMAYGHVVPQDLTWIKHEIEQKGQGKKIILVTHYPILKGDIDNWYQVTDFVRRFNVLTFIGGHYHRNAFFQYDGIPGFLGRANLRDKNDRSGYTVYQVTPDSLLVYEQAYQSPIRKWGGISLTKQYYNVSGHADSYPSFEVNKKYPQVIEKWKINSSVGIYCSPVVDKSLCFVGNDLGQLTCYKWQTGHKQWMYQAKGRIIGTPGVNNGVVVFGTTENSIYGIRINTGKLLWKITTTEAVMGSVAIQGNIAYVGGSDHTMRAINIHTGKVLWAYDKVSGYVVTKPLVASGLVIFGAWDDNLYALNQMTGRLVWKWQNSKNQMHYSPAGVWPVATKKAVFIVDPQRAMTAIDILNGKTLWRTYQSKVRESLGISLDKQRLYAKTMQDSIVCYAADPKESKELWACNVGFGYEHATTMLEEKNGKVYSSTKEGLIISVEGKTGKLNWIHKTGNSFINTVTPIDDKHLLFTETSGEIVLLQYPE